MARLTPRTRLAVVRTGVVILAVALGVGVAEAQGVDGGVGAPDEARRGTDSGSESESESDSAARSAAGSDSEFDSGSESESDSESDSAARSDAGSESDFELDSERESDVDPDARERLLGTPRYLLESVEIVGNRRTRPGVIRVHVPLDHGDVIDPESDVLEAIEWRLRGTGWFDEVHLRLRRGSERGWVVLVVEVRERNTMVIRDLVFGISEGLTGSRDPDADILPYVGFSIAETNLTGTGIALSLAGLMSQTQQGVDVGFAHPSVHASPYALRAGAFLNNAREFYGNDPVISQTCPEDVPDCVEEVEAKNAVVFYRRGGVRFGFARSAGPSTHYSIDWQGEIVRVLSRPEAASTMRGTEPRPIDFGIQDGTSFVSLLRFGLLYDRRDDPGIPSQGSFIRLQGDVGTRLLGSSYDFIRLEGLARWWHAIRPRHVLRLSGYAGVVFGEAPFFYRFHVSDLSDLLPSRVLEMQIDRRPANDFFGTPIRYMSNEEIAVRLDVQYDFAVYRSLRRPSLRGLNVFANVGIFGLADPLDMRVAVPGFDGIARAPLDLTFDLGLTAETTIGVFQFGFSNLLGFIDL